MQFNKDLYSKEKINEMIFEKSLLNDYQKMIDERNGLIALISLGVCVVLIGIPVGISVFWFYFKLNLSLEELLLRTLIVFIIGVIAFVILFFILVLILNKILGKIQSFKDFSEPFLLGYELALKRFEVENKIQDYEFMFNNKEFFHGLNTIRDLLNVRHIELSNELSFIPIEKRNRENEIYQMILERQMQNRQQVDWLEKQLDNLSK